MCFQKGELRNDVIVDSDNNYSLEGMVCPTFQNNGGPVLVNGIKLLTGESFAINVPNVVLTNSIPVVFLSNDRKLAIGYIVLKD